MKFDPASLQKALDAAGIRCEGCDETGHICYLTEADESDRAKAAAILAVHDYEACCAAEEQVKVDEQKIAAEIRAMAIERLQARQELPRDYNK